MAAHRMQPRPTTGDDASATLWQRLRRSVLAPRVDEAAVDRALAIVHERLPLPVVWLFGKTQSGKTSIIRALTGNTRAEIGSGFRACTRTAQLYSFPNEEEAFVHFMDTRGLGEVDYDPSEDLHWLEGQTHIVMVVVKAMDHAQSCVLQPLRKILEAGQNRPVIVVQTSLHEAYPHGVTRHLEPYPFIGLPYPSTIGDDLRRSLEVQREWFAGRDTRFVPVDFTLPDDGYTPATYGLETLWQTIDDVLPLGLQYLIRQSRMARDPLRDAYFQAAHPHVVFYALAAGTAGGVPVPWIDVPIVLAIQGKLFHTIASIYGQKMGGREFAELSGTLGLGSVMRLAGREVLKLVPGLGSVSAAVFAGASTYALGCTLCAYFSHVRDGDVPDARVLRELYRQQYAEGRKRLAAYLGQAVSREERRS